MIFDNLGPDELLVTFNHLDLSELRGKELQQVICLYLDVDEVEQNLYAYCREVIELIC